MPPYGSVSWYKKFLDLIHRRKPDKADLEFIRLNIARNRNEYKISKGLRFLGVITEDGTPTEKLDLLRVTGDEYKKNLEQIVKEAYQHLFSKIIVEEAEPEDVVNYFIGKYDCSMGTSESALRVFVFLCDEAGILLSEKMKTIKIEKVGRLKRKKRVAKPKAKPKREIKEGIPMVLEGMQKLEYAGRFLMFLRKGDRSTRERVAKIAKQFIDTYVEEEELETEK